MNSLLTNRSNKTLRKDSNLIKFMLQSRNLLDVNEVPNWFIERTGAEFPSLCLTFDDPYIYGSKFRLCAVPKGPVVVERVIPSRRDRQATRIHPASQRRRSLTQYFNEPGSCGETGFWLRHVADYFVHDAGLGVFCAQRAAWLALQAMEVDDLGRVEVTGGSVPGAPVPYVVDGLDADAVEAGEHVCMFSVSSPLGRLVLEDVAGILL